MSAQGAASALAWWREAGVDTIVAEEPRDWLAVQPSASEAPAAPKAAECLPDTLESFRTWLATSETLPFAAPSAPRVGPSGDPGSGLMVLVDMPSAQDAAAGKLLSGEEGALFDRMMAAIGRGRETLYLAALSPVRSPTGQLDAASAATLAPIARHHAGLVRPKALLLFGDACAKALLGAAVAGTRGRWHEIETPTGRVRTLATLKPEKLIRQPNLKKHAWEDLQRLKEGLEP
jgi:uracil-DNA glycosylase